MKYCTQCGNEMHDLAVVCVKCGCSCSSAGSAAANTPANTSGRGAEGNDMDKSGSKSEKDGIVSLLLAIFLGYLGIHRFYVGKIGTGVLMLLTAGGCGIWQFIDIIMIAVGSFTDAEGKVVKL